MSRERFDQAIVQEIEDELREALRLEPSPDFARQVRARIERDTPAVMPRLFWPALAAAAACMLAFGIGWRVTRDSEVPLKPDATIVSTRVATDVRLEPEARLEGQVRFEPHVRLKLDTTKIVKRVEPEVIVPPDRARALARLLELVRSGAVDEESLRPIVSASAPATLDVAPIVVPSIPVPEIEIENRTARGGAGQE